MTKRMVITNVCIAHDSSRYPLGILNTSPPSAGHPIMDQPGSVPSALHVLHS